jgi:hypothetical protein
MRAALITTSIALIALHGTASAGPVRACAQVAARVDGEVISLLANLAESKPAATQFPTQFRTCLSSHNICSVLYNARRRDEELIAGDVTADLPARSLSGNGDSFVIFLVRSIPRVRNDSNQYCLVSEKHSGATPGQWDVYGWVIAPVGNDPLPLKRQAMDHRAASDARSMRGLAAALWFFAERMSGSNSASAEGTARDPGTR